MLAQRFERQLLGSERGTDVAAVAGRLLAVQAQDLRSARLAVRARTEDSAVAEIDRAIGEERSVVVCWLNRGTLHLVRSDDYWWLHALTTPPLFTANARRLAQTGVTPRSRARRRADRACARRRGADDARRAARPAGRARIPTAGQALVHLLDARVPARHRPPRAVRRQAATPTCSRATGSAAGAFDRDRALGELARRYLAGHAPADERDLAKWAGLPLRDARAGLARSARGRGGCSSSERASPRPCLLDQWDPAARRLALARGAARRLSRSERPRSALPPVRVRRRPSGRDVEAEGRRGRLGEPFARLSRAARAALDHDAAAVGRFLIAA